MSQFSFIHTSSLSVSKSLEPLMKDIHQTTSTSLISLIDGLGSSNSSIKSINKTARDLKEYKQNYKSKTIANFYTVSSFIS